MAMVDWSKRLGLDADEATPILVFGGPYSNLSATIAMRAEAERLGIPAHRVICTGDVVAYCAEPEETALAIESWGCHVLAGNCEEQLAAGAGDCGCGFEDGTACDLLAKGWYPFADRRVTAPRRDWMRGLDRAARFSWMGRSFRVVHGSVETVNEFVFASDISRIDGQLALADADVVIAGHAGIPFIVKRPGGVWFNAGVIGMPANDGTADAWYGLITPGAKGFALSFARLKYEFSAAAASMRRWAYADGYARSLVTGIWPSFDILPEAERQATGVRIRPRTMAVPYGAAVAAAAS
jgi:predicted phosphodiesterase